MYIHDFSRFALSLLDTRVATVSHLNRERRDSLASYLAFYSFVRRVFLGRKKRERERERESQQLARSRNLQGRSVSET